MHGPPRYAMIAALLGFGCGVVAVDHHADIAETGGASDSGENTSTSSVGTENSGSSESTDSMDSLDSTDFTSSSSDSDGSESSGSESSASESSASESGCVEGEFGCACGPSDACGPGLVCEAGLCLSATCGDGQVTAPEECDDGNLVDADGCNANCTPTQVVAIDAGNDFTCVLLDSGDVKCWGLSTYGQLGQGNNNIIGDAETPATIPPIALPQKAISVQAGADHACALLSSHDVMCWGYGNSGRLGYANTNNIGDDEIPASTGTVEVGGPVAQIALGDATTCAILESGYATCWGVGSSYQLGTGNNTNIGDNEHPGSVGVLNVNGKIDQMAPGSSHTCALREDQTAHCWGHGGYGKLGYANTSTITSADIAPTINLQGKLVGALVAGPDNTCARSQTGEVLCWGLGAYGVLGYGNPNAIGDNELPGPALGLPLASEIAIGNNHVCALLDSGEVTCWGQGSYGKLGYGNVSAIGDDELASSVGTISLGGSALAITAGRDHTCALLDTHEVVCWGRGQYGALGYGSPINIGDNELPSSAGTVEVF